MSIDELIEKLEKSTGPDRGLDADIDAYLFGGHPAKHCHDRTRRSYGAGFIHNDDDGSNLTKGGRNSKPLTASVDVALEVADRKLPEWDFEIATKDDGEWYVRLTLGNYPHHAICSGSHKYFSIAILIALLRALKNQEVQS